MHANLQWQEKGHVFPILSVVNDNSTRKDVAMGIATGFAELLQVFAPKSWTALRCRTYKLEAQVRESLVSNRTR